MGVWSAVRTGISNAAQDLLHSLNAGFRRCVREWIVPSDFTSPVPSLGIGAVPAVTMVLAFRYHAVLDQDPERPALQGKVSAATGRGG